MDLVYASPQHIETLATSTPISENVLVDFELQGCPINKNQLFEVLSAFLNDRHPAIGNYSVCMECKRKGNVCVMVASATSCLGPVTHAGCDALCPSYSRGCYGCYGPSEATNTTSLARAFSANGMDEGELLRVFRTFNAYAPAFRQESERHE